jgi:hypothetical protein
VNTPFSKSTPPITHIRIFTAYRGYLLTVFFTKLHCWQFRVTTLTGDVFGMQLPYDSADVAERVGRNWIDFRSQTPVTQSSGFNVS